MFESNRVEHPVVSVSWEDADTFCRWAGKRLPTEAEFEYGIRAGTTTRYWWGEGGPGSRHVENIGDDGAKSLLDGDINILKGKDIMSGYDDGAVRTALVGSYEANPWGAYDVNGNVMEWMADWYDESYYKMSPVHNPEGASGGEYRVVRGGSWDSGPVDVRSASRKRRPPTYRSDNIGFRCAQDIK